MGFCNNYQKIKRMASSLGVHKKKPMKHKMKMKRFLKKVVNYLKSDSYMFSHLVSSQYSDLSPPNAIFTTTGKETKEHIEDNKLLRKFGEFLMSECYMYAPLIVPQPPLYNSDGTKFSPSHTGLTRYTKEAAAATPEENGAVKIKFSAKQTENQQADAYPSPRTIVVQHTRVYRDTVKHMIHQNCCSSSVSGGSLEEPRKIVVE